MSVDISHSPVNNVSSSKVQITDPDQVDNFNDIEHQAAMALLIEDSISSAEGRDHGHLLPNNRLGSYCNSFLVGQRPGVVYSTLQGYTSPPNNDLPLMIASEALPIYKKVVPVRPKVFNQLQKRQLGGLSSPLSLSPSNSSLMNISAAKILPGRSVVADRVRSQLKFGRGQPSPLAVCLRQQPSRSVLGTLVSDGATTPMQDKRQRSPDAQTLKRSSVQQKQGFESTATMLLPPPANGSAQYFQITPAVRITSYGDSTKTQAYTTDNRRQPKKEEMSADLYRDGVMAKERKAVIEVRPIDEGFHPLRARNTGALTQENASQLSQGGRIQSQCEESRSESKTQVQGSVYYDAKRFKGQLKKQTDKVDSKKSEDPEMTRLIQQKEREVAAHMEQIYKFEKTPKLQETSMYFATPSMGQTTKQIVKSKKPMSLTQRGKLVNKSKSNSLSPTGQTSEQYQTHAQAIYTAKDSWKEQSPEVTFTMDPENCDNMDPKYVTYFPPEKQTVEPNEDLQFELPLGCGRGFKSFATQPIKLHQKPKLATLISRSPSYQSSNSKLEQTDQLLANLRISPAKKSPKKMQFLKNQNNRQLIMKKIEQSQNSSHTRINYKSQRKVDKWLDSQMVADYSHLIHNAVTAEIINAHRTLKTPSKHLIYGDYNKMEQTDSHAVTTGHRSRKSDTIVTQTGINRDLGHFNLNDREKDETVTSRLLVDDRHEESQAYLQPMQENTLIGNVITSAIPKPIVKPQLLQLDDALKVRGIGQPQRQLIDQTMQKTKTDNLSEDKSDIILQPLNNLVSNATILIQKKPLSRHQIAVQADLTSGSDTPQTRQMYNTHFHSPTQKQFKPPFIKQLHEVAIQEQSEHTQSTVGHLTRNMFNTAIGKKSTEDMIMKQIPEHFNVMIGSRQNAFLTYSGDVDTIVSDNMQAISLTKQHQLQQKQSVKVYIAQLAEQKANDIIRENDLDKRDLQTPISRWDAEQKAFTRTTEEGPRLNTVSDAAGMRGHEFREGGQHPPPTVGAAAEGVAPPETRDLMKNDAFMQNEVRSQNKPKITIKQMQQEEINMYQSGQIHLNKHQLRLELPQTTTKRDSIHEAGMKSAVVFRNTGGSNLRQPDEETDSPLVMGGVTFHQSLFAKQKRMQDLPGLSNVQGPEKPQIASLVMGNDQAQYELALAGFKPGTEKQASPQQILLSNPQNYLDKSNPQVFLNRDLQGDFDQKQVPLIKKKLTKSNRKQQKSNAKLVKGSTVEHRGDQPESPQSKPLLRSPSPPPTQDPCSCKAYSPPTSGLKLFAQQQPHATQLHTREVGVGVMSNPATAMQIKQLNPSPSHVDYNSRINDLVAVSRGESDQLAYLYANQGQSVEGRILDVGQQESTTDHSQNKLQQAQYENGEVRELMHNTDLRDYNRKYKEIHSKLAKNATDLEYKKELKSMIQSTEIKPIQLPNAEPKTHNKMISPMAIPSILSPDNSKEKLCKVSEEKSSKISYLKTPGLNPGITAQSNSTLHQPTAEFAGIAPKTAQSALSKDGIIKGSVKIIPKSNQSALKEILIMDVMAESATEDEEPGTMRFSQVLSKQDSLLALKQSGVNFFLQTDQFPQNVAPRKIMPMQVTTKTVFMKNKSSERFEGLPLQECDKKTTISILTEKSQQMPQNVEKKQKSLDMYDLSRLVNMKAPPVRQMQQMKADYKHRPIDKLLTEQQLKELRKILDHMRSQNQQHTHTQRYLEKKHTHLQRNQTNMTSYHTMGRANQRPSAFARSKYLSPDQSPTSSVNSITRDISDANFFPQGPRFHSSLKSYGEMVLIHDASQTMPKRSISPAPSMLQTKFSFSPKTTPYVFNDVKRIKESMKRTNQLMNAFNIPTSPYSTAERTDLS